MIMSDTDELRVPVYSSASPHGAADVNGRPIHPMQPLPITSWDQAQPAYPHVGYAPDVTWFPWCTQLHSSPPMFQTT